MHRCAFGLVAVLGLAGCGTTFAPQYDQTLYDHLSAASGGVHNIAAAAHLAALPPSTYPAHEAQYVSILGDLRAADAIAKNRADQLKDKPSGKAASLISQMIEGCEDTVQTVIDQHKSTDGLPKGAFDPTPSVFEQNCDIPLKAESKLQELAAH